MLAERPTRHRPGNVVHNNVVPGPPWHVPGPPRDYETDEHADNASVSGAADESRSRSRSRRSEERSDEEQRMTLDIFRSGRDNELLFTVELDYNLSWQQALSTIAARLPRTDIRYAYLVTRTDDPIVAISYADAAGALILVNDRTTYSNLQEFSHAHGHKVCVTLRPQSNLGARRAVAGAAAGHPEELHGVRLRRKIEEKNPNQPRSGGAAAGHQGVVLPRSRNSRSSSRSRSSITHPLPNRARSITPLLPIRARSPTIPLPNAARSLPLPSSDRSGTSSDRSVTPRAHSPTIPPPNADRRRSRSRSRVSQPLMQDVNELRSRRSEEQSDAAHDEEHLEAVRYSHLIDETGAREAEHNAAQQQSDTQGLKEKTKEYIQRLFEATKHLSGDAQKKAWNNVLEKPFNNVFANKKTHGQGAEANHQSDSRSGSGGAAAGHQGVVLPRSRNSRRNVAEE